VIQLDDGGACQASAAQLWLWKNWNTYWQRVDAVRRLHDAELTEVFNGDLTEGWHHHSTAVLSGNPTAQAACVNAVLSIPLHMNPDHIAVIRGTPAHVGDGACYEERIAVGMHKDGRPVIPCEASGTYSHWHLRMELGGIRFDFAHHGRVGTRPHTKPNVVAGLAAEIFYNHASKGIPHPHIAIRSHMHQLVDTYDQHPVRVIQTPAWQLATSFIHRIAPGVLADIGGLIFVIKDGQVEVEKVMFPPDPSPLWTNA
jgi:hypothetical protein